MSIQTDRERLSGVKGEYQYGFRDVEKPVFKSERGLNHGVIDQISDHKNEPRWMREFRHLALDIFLSKPMPTWGADLSGIDFDEIFYYLRPSGGVERSWDEVPEGIKNTFERLGIPEAERKFLAGVGAQYDSEVVYHSLRQEWEKMGVIFLDMDTGLREHEDIAREYSATIIPASDNKFAALNSAVWSGGCPAAGRAQPLRHLPLHRIEEEQVSVGHEASVSKIGDEQLFYLNSRGIGNDEAAAMIVGGFIEPLVKELPMEYAVEMNRLIQLQMEGSIG